MNNQKHHPIILKDPQIGGAGDIKKTNCLQLQASPTFQPHDFIDQFLRTPHLWKQSAAEKHKDCSKGIIILVLRK